MERLATLSEPTAVASEPDPSDPVHPVENPIEAPLVALDTIVGEVVEHVDHALEPANEPDALARHQAAEHRADSDDARRPAPKPEFAERVVTRTVERAVESGPRTHRPTVGERMTTHDFRLHPVDRDDPEMERTTRSSDLVAEQPWIAPTQPRAEGAPEPLSSPALDVPGLPGDLTWTARDHGPGASGEAFVWDARSAMRFPEPAADPAAPATSTVDEQEAGDEPSAAPLAVPALEGFSIRPPRRRRTLQVGIPSQRLDRAPELVTPRPQPMVPANFVHDHGELEEGDGDSGQPPAAMERQADIASDDATRPEGGQAGATATPAHDADAMADELYDRIRGRLRQELLIDRERNLLLTDLR